MQTTGRTWVDLGFYAIDHAVPILQATGFMVTAMCSSVAAVVTVLGKLQLNRQDKAIETIRQDVNSTNAASIAATKVAADDKSRRQDDEIATLHDKLEHKVSDPGPNSGGAHP
jgi:hypothetical protein